MQLFRFARHPSRLIRSALLALALMLGANAVAHAEHDHAAPTAKHAACGYCVTFGGLADSPAHAPFILAPIAAQAPRATRIVSFIGHSARTHTQPRAPPVLPSLI